MPFFHPVSKKVKINFFIIIKKGRLESTLPSAFRRLESTLLHHLCDSALVDHLRSGNMPTAIKVVSYS